MFDVVITTDNVQGRTNRGGHYEMSFQGRDELGAYLNMYTKKYGKPFFVSGMALWENKNICVTASIYKDNAPFEASSLIS